MKPLASPYLWLLLLQGGAVLWWWRRRAPTAAAADRRVVRLLAASWGVMTLLSLDPVATALEVPLVVADSPPGPAPDVIFVLGDGIERGETPADDRITSSEWDRVRLAATWWREQHTARIVLSGRSRAARRTAEHLGELARAVLLDAGVPDSVIVIEPRSTSTWTNAAEALRLPGISRTMRVGIVTSDWHMRRARRAFTGAFAGLQWRSAPEGTGDLEWSSALPSPEALAKSGDAVKEWVGNVVYALRHVIDAP